MQTCGESLRPWKGRVGRVWGMKHVYAGKIAPADHKDKCKSILSRTPLAGRAAAISSARRANLQFPGQPGFAALARRMATN